MKAYIVAEFITKFCNQFVINKFDSDDGIYFIIKVSAQCLGFSKDNEYHYEWTGNDYRFVHFIITGVHEVFCAVTNHTDVSSPETWDNLSNHDSCWENVISSTLCKIGFEMWDNAFKNCPKDHQPKTKDEDLSFSVYNFSGLCKKVTIEKEPVDDYFWNLKKIKVKE